MARKYLNKLEGKLVVVIGGTSGIGLAVAEASVEHGAHVVVASRTQENIDNAVERLKQSYPEFAENVRGHPCNNSSSNAEAEIVKLFDFVTDSGAKKIDHIIDTSGETGPVVGKLEDVTSEIWLEDYRVRLVGAALVGKNAAKYMRQESSSSYTMTSGVLTARPMKGLSPRLTAGGEHIPPCYSGTRCSRKKRTDHLLRSQRNAHQNAGGGPSTDSGQLGGSWGNRHTNTPKDVCQGRTGGRRAFQGRHPCQADRYCRGRRRVVPVLDEEPFSYRDGLLSRGRVPAYIVIQTYIMHHPNLPKEKCRFSLDHCVLRTLMFR